MRDVYIIGVGMLRFGKFPNRSIKDLSAQALNAALEDAGLSAADIEALWFANSGWGMNGGQDSIRGQVALRPIGVESIPIINVENACAGGSTALNGAWLGVASGAFEVGVALGAEKVFQPDKLKMFAGFLGALDVENLPALLKQAEEVSKEAAPVPSQPRSNGHSGGKSKNPVERIKGLGEKLGELPTLVRDIIVISDRYNLDLAGMAKENLSKRLASRKGGGGGNGTGGVDHSPFMDVYSLAARRHMQKYGSTQQQLALIAAKNHYHSSLNVMAQIQKDMTPEQVLADKLISYPLTRPMCAPVGDGAAAAIVCSGAFLRKHGKKRAVKILASVIASGRARNENEADIGERASKIAYDKAGIGPNDVSLAEVHDATAYGELHQSEALGFCEHGMGGVLAESGATRIGGRIPLNTSGGLESRGHPIGASGLAQIFEVVTQLRHEAGNRQVEGARIGLTQNGGGALGVEEAAMGIHLLESPGA